MCGSIRFTAKKSACTKIQDLHMFLALSSSNQQTTRAVSHFYHIERIASRISQPLLLLLLVVNWWENVDVVWKDMQCSGRCSVCNHLGGESFRNWRQRLLSLGEQLRVVETPTKLVPLLLCACCLSAPSLYCYTVFSRVRKSLTLLGEIRWHFVEAVTCWNVFAHRLRRAIHFFCSLVNRFGRGCELLGEYLN